ncbi:MAG: hypothetical protein IJT87_04875 [Ruminiclostridium sp.]|nr:hypothetical protein [Ruminiclostridium sp.]
MLIENTLRMPYTELTVGGTVYMLRLTALSAARLEERIGMSVYKAVENADKVSVAAELLYALIEGLRPEFTKRETFEVIDGFIGEGGTLPELGIVIAGALRNSGFFGEASPRQASSFAGCTEKQ